MNTSPTDTVKLTYYGTAETAEIAEAVITLKVITDEWRILIPPTPLIKQHKVNGGVLLQHVGVWFILHRFHRADDLGVTE